MGNQSLGGGSAARLVDSRAQPLPSTPAIRGNLALGVLLCKVDVSPTPASRRCRGARDAVWDHQAPGISSSGPGSAGSPRVGLLTLAPANPEPQQEDRKEGAL